MPEDIEPIDADFDDVAKAMVTTDNAPVVTGPIPHAVVDGFLPIAKIEIPCAVLDDIHNTRVLTQGGFLKSIGRAGKAKGGEGSTADGMPPFLRAKNLIPFITSDLIRSTEPIIFETRRGNTAFGYRATLLPSVCWVYHDARLAGKLLPPQEHIAKACEQLLRALTDKAINDLVDEATGFRDMNRRRVFEDVLRQYVSPEALPWALAPGVLAEIQRTVPRDDKGRPKVRFHQMLSEHVGHPKLREFLEGIKALMRISPNWSTFQDHLKRAYPHFDEALQLSFLDRLTFRP